MSFSTKPTADYTTEPAEYRRQLRWLKTHSSLRGFVTKTHDKGFKKGVSSPSKCGKHFLCKTLEKELLQRVCTHWELCNYSYSYKNFRGERIRDYMNPSNANEVTHLREWMLSKGITEENFAEVFNQCLDHVKTTTFATFYHDYDKHCFKLDKHDIHIASDVDDIWDLGWADLVTDADTFDGTYTDKHLSDRVNLADNTMEHYEYKQNEQLFNPRFWEHDCLSF